jgi:hypothetical protein
MRGGDAKPRRAASRAQPRASIEESARAEPARVHREAGTQTRAKAKLSRGKKEAARVERPGRREIRMRHVIAEAVASFPGAPCGESLATRP